MSKYKFQYKLNVFDINTIIFPHKRTHYNLAKNYNPPLTNEILLARFKITYKSKPKSKIKRIRKITKEFKSIDNNNQNSSEQLNIYNSKPKNIFSKLKSWIISIFN